jgi:sarcosine oxidase subunit alpha
MPDLVTLFVDGQRIQMPVGSTVSAAILTAGGTQFRTSVTGEPRGPLCGMGVCFECRVIIDGQLHRRTCMVVAQAGMTVETT